MQLARLKAYFPRGSQTPEPAPAPTPVCKGAKLRWYKADVHARALVAYAYTGVDPIAPGSVLSRDLQLVYADMLIELGWGERPWSTVGMLVRNLTGGRKTYTWWEDDDGVSHRLRCYVFAPNRPAAITSADIELISSIS